MTSTDQGTTGRVAGPGGTYHSIELPWRENRTRISCIPEGVYRCALVQSPRFGRVYHVESVPGRSAVLIHPANVAGDRLLGFDTELEGCIALGLQAGLMRNKAGSMQTCVLLSRPAVRQFMDSLKGEPFQLEITSCSPQS